MAVLKLCDLKNDEKFNHLNQVQIHNLSKEQSVALENFELDIRGKQNLESVSLEMID